MILRQLQYTASQSSTGSEAANSTSLTLLQGQRLPPPQQLQAQQGGGHIPRRASGESLRASPEPGLSLLEAQGRSHSESHLRRLAGKPLPELQQQQWLATGLPFQVNPRQGLGKPQGQSPVPLPLGSMPFNGYASPVQNGVYLAPQHQQLVWQLLQQQLQGQSQLPAGPQQAALRHAQPHGQAQATSTAGPGVQWPPPETLQPPAQVVDDIPMTDLERLMKHITPRLGPSHASGQDVKLVSQSLQGARIVLHFYAAYPAAACLSTGWLPAVYATYMGGFTTSARSCSCVHCSIPHAHHTCLMQADIWKWFLEPSLFGTDVLTLGGSRGPSVSYYVPYLSAMQLLLPAVPRATTPGHPSRAQAGSEAAAPAAGAQRGLREAGRPAHGKVYQLAQEWRGWPAQVSSAACSWVLQGRSCLPR